MKKTVLLSAAVMSCLFASAQHRWNTLHHEQTPNQHKHFINKLLRAQSAGNAAQKPTTLQQRVIAEAYSDDSEQDSLTYQYSGTRGSRFDHNVLGFNYNSEYGSTYAPLISPYLYEQNPLNVLADTIRSYSANTLSEVRSGHFRADNKLDSFQFVYLGGSGTQYDKTRHSFYTGGYIKDMTNLSSTDGINYDLFSIRKLTYNTGFTQVVTDTMWADFGSGLMPLQKMEYHYNAQNKVDTIKQYGTSGSDFELSAVYAFSYTAGKLQKMITYAAGPDTLYLNMIDSFAYAGSSPNFSYYEGRYYDVLSGEMMDGSRIVKYLNSSNLPDSAVLYYFDGGTWEEDVHLQYAYNTYNNPTSISATDASGPAGAIHFYYELYEDGVNSIPSISENKDYDLYPNPFHNGLSIDWKGAQSDVTVRLYNVLGQEVYNNKLKLRSGKNTLEIPGLNTGNYILILRDANGKAWSSKVVKQ